MKIEIKNMDLGKVIYFLEQQNFKGLKSIMRSKLTNFLSVHLQEVIEGEKTILKDYKDDENKLEAEMKAYNHETIIVEGGNMLKPLNVVKQKIKELTSEECEQDFSGQDAYALSVLYEAFKLDEEGENK